MTQDQLRLYLESLPNYPHFTFADYGQDLSVKYGADFHGNYWHCKLYWDFHSGQVKYLKQPDGATKYGMDALMAFESHTSTFLFDDIALDIIALDDE